MKLTLAIALCQCLALSAAAEADPSFMRHLFPPELVMRNQHEVGLSQAQRKAITSAIHDTQGRVLEIEWKLQDEARKLGEMLAAERIDEEAALAQVGRVLDLEEKVKKAHMGLLIRIRNELVETVAHLGGNHRVAACVDHL